jgi:hypothetical protein
MGKAAIEANELLSAIQNQISNFARQCVMPDKSKKDPPNVKISVYSHQSMSESDVLRIIKKSISDLMVMIDSGTVTSITGERFTCILTEGNIMRVHGFVDGDECEGSISNTLQRSDMYAVGYFSVQQSQLQAGGFQISVQYHKN